MRNRNIQVIVRLNRDEDQKLRKSVKKSGLSQEAYLRQLINGFVPRESPPADYFTFMRALRAVGNTLNQIARKAHALQVIDAQAYEMAVGEYRWLVSEIAAAVILPERR